MCSAELLPFDHIVLSFSSLLRLSEKYTKILNKDPVAEKRKRACSLILICFLCSLYPIPFASQLHSYHYSLLFVGLNAAEGE